MTAAALAALLAAGALLAGCSSPKGSAAPEEIVVESRPPEEVSSNATATQRRTDGTGHLAGVVVDEAIRPLQGARIHLPNIDLEEASDRDGAFAFTDLPAATYSITVGLAGYVPASTVVEVQAGEFTRVKVVLRALPPPSPYHTVRAYDGFMQVTNGPVGQVVAYGFLCEQCEAVLDLPRDGLRAVILEATMSPYAGAAAGSNGFQHAFGVRGSFTRASEGLGGNPLYVPLRDASLAPRMTAFELHVEPYGDPAPESGKAFRYFASAWYNGDPPAGWSVVAGGS